MLLIVGLVVLVALIALFGDDGRASSSNSALRHGIPRNEGRSQGIMSMNDPRNPIGWTNMNSLNNPNGWTNMSSLNNPNGWYTPSSPNYVFKKH
jgi:hypothetical protein